MNVPHHASEAGPVREGDLVERNGLLHAAGDGEVSSYRRRWEDEAAEDHVRSAIASGSTGALTYETLTAKVSPLWDRFPRGSAFGTMLEIGSGYGRIPLYLARERDVSWSTYCAVDISETMLHRFVEYREQYASNPDSRLYPICISADNLPLEDDSVDIAISSAVFLHMGKSFAARAVAEIARTLRPNGHFVFDSSFPNARNPPNLVPRLKPQRLRPPNFMKYWTRAEVESLLVQTGLAAKAVGFTVEPSSYALLPKRVGPVPVPFARGVNARLAGSPRRFADVLASTYSAYSPGLLE
jgi:SAM-dependent methyltransferase